MRFSRTFSALFIMAVFFLSCNDEKKTDSQTTTGDSSSVVKSDKTTSSTIITSPQNMVVVRHRVADFGKWKASYDAHDSMRLAAGLHTYVISRGLEDTNMVMIAIRADDMEKAKAFSQSPSLKAAMQKGGVTGAPKMDFTILTYQDTSVQSTPMRSMTTFTVKDWAAWEKSFLEATQERIDNGLMVRAYGHDAANNNRVTLVTAIIDSAKAAAYWMSDKLKARRAAAGVIGVPERFLYRVIQRY